MPAVAIRNASTPEWPSRADASRHPAAGSRQTRDRGRVLTDAFSESAGLHRAIGAPPLRPSSSHHRASCRWNWMARVRTSDAHAGRTPGHEPPDPLDKVNSRVLPFTPKGSAHDSSDLALGHLLRVNTRLPRPRPVRRLRQHGTEAPVPQPLHREQGGQKREFNKRCFPVVTVRFESFQRVRPQRCTRASPP